MDREIELKFLIDPEAADPILALLEGEGAVRQLDATYFDTADHALRRAGFGLRVRDGEGGRKQTLKSASAGGLFARGEWESPIVGPGPDGATLAGTPAAAIVNGDALHPVFTTCVERTVRLVRRDDAVIEVVVDRGDLIAEGRRAAVCELELELKAGQPSALFDLARDLARQVPMRLSLISKAERGYGLAMGKDAPPRTASPLDPGSTTAEALQALGRGALDRMCVAAEVLRTHPSPDKVHGLRVAVRRFRALLSVFKPLAKDPVALSIRVELKWIADALSPARALDVFMAEVWRPATESQSRLVEDDVRALAAFGKALLEAQSLAYGVAVKAVDSLRFRALALDAAAWLEAGVWSTDESLEAIRSRPIATFAAHALDKRWEQIRKGGKDLAALSAEARHALRLRGKTLRYAVEDLAAVFPEHPKRIARFISATRDLQDSLGALNDLAAREALARSVALSCDDPAAAFAAGRLAAGEGERESEGLDAARAAYDDFIDAKIFW